MAKLLLVATIVLAAAGTNNNNKQLNWSSNGQIPPRYIITTIHTTENDTTCDTNHIEFHVCTVFVSRVLDGVSCVK